MDYDGIAEVWVDSLEDWNEVLSDPAFVKEVGGEWEKRDRSRGVRGQVTDVLPADEQLFILAPIHVQLSYDRLVIPGSQAAQVGTTEA